MPSLRKVWQQGEGHIGCSEPGCWAHKYARWIGREHLWELATSLQQLSSHLQEPLTTSRQLVCCCCCHRLVQKSAGESIYVCDPHRTMNLEVLCNPDSLVKCSSVIGQEEISLLIERTESWTSRSLATHRLLDNWSKGFRIQSFQSSDSIAKTSLKIPHM